MAVEFGPVFSLRPPVSDYLSPQNLILNVEAKVKSTYPEGFIEQALVKVFSRGDRSVRSVAEDLNVNYHTVKYWMKRKALDKTAQRPLKEKRPQDWSAEQQLVALHETHGLSTLALNAALWVRRVRRPLALVFIFRNSFKSGQL